MHRVDAFGICSYYPDRDTVSYTAAIAAYDISAKSDSVSAVTRTYMHLHGLHAGPASGRRDYSLAATLAASLW